MWPSISDMSRDECRKCLRCLELDAYGNMVSVLRAQGPFTEEKQKLLGELTKVLHISNERHRAEIRRAVNDEKLSVIAEQLNGPNTCTDWAIEGRRTIPLLPRLKAHTAFTGLANSLSLVIAAANEKKLSSSNKIEDPLVKAETALREETELDERPIGKLPVINTELSARGRKRKRSTGFHDNEKCRKVQLTETKVCDSERNSISPLEQEDSLANEKNESTKIVQVSIVTPSSTVDTTCRNDETLGNSSTNVTNCRKSITANVRNCEDKNSEGNILVIDPSLNDRRDIANDIVVAQRSIVEKKSQVTEQIVGDSTRENEKEKKISRPDSTTPGTPSSKRLITTKFCVTTKPIITSSTNCVVTVNSGSTTSCGPGPPCVTPSTTLTYKKLPSGKLNHHSGTKMGITLNSSKTLKLNAHPNARLATKANVIVVQKGSSRGVTISHGGKEVLGKVIMGGTNLCLASQKSSTTSVALLPHRGGASNNGEQILTTLNTNHPDTLKIGTKAGNVIMLDIRQDVIDQNVVLSHLLEASEKLKSDTRNTNLVNSKNTHQTITKSHVHDSSNAIVARSPKIVSLVNGSRVELSEKLETSNEDCSRYYSFDDNGDSSDVKDNPEIIRTIDEEKIETHGILDAQTGIYNYEPTDGIIIEERMEESIQTSGIDIFSTALDSPDINIENIRYANEDDEEIVIETNGQSIDDDTFRVIDEQIEQLDDS